METNFEIILEIYKTIPIVYVEEKNSNNEIKGFLLIKNFDNSEEITKISLQERLNNSNIEVIKKLGRASIRCSIGISRL